VFEVGVHQSQHNRQRTLHYFTMQLLEGETLSARIRRVGRFSKGDAFPLAIQMAEGLAAAHAAGVVHRDFKSGNVMLVPGPSGDRVVITDFGLALVDPAARRPGSTATMTGGQIVGTVAYMSPEQLTGGLVTTASDIYSFGIVLYEMATGHVPFDDLHLINAAVQRASGKIPGLRTDSGPQLGSSDHALSAARSHPSVLHSYGSRRLLSRGVLADSPSPMERVSMGRDGSGIRGRRERDRWNLVRNSSAL
jgi:serine/threonine protein kinase